MPDGNPPRPRPLMPRTPRSLRAPSAERQVAFRVGISAESRAAAICRELTKLHEEVRRGDLKELAAHYAGDAETRGEFVIVIAPPEPLAEAADLDTLLREALGRLSVKEAVAEIASITGQPRREVYQRALALTKDEAPHDA